MSKTKLSGRAVVIRLDRDELRVALMVLGTAMPNVIHSVVMPVPEGAVDDGFIAQPEVVKNLLRTALLEPEFKRCHKAVFSLCTTQIITEITTAPKMSEKKLDKMLRSNMDMYFPVDTKDYNLVWKITGTYRNEEDKDELGIQLWAVSNSILGRYYALANDCGLKVAAVQWCGSSSVSFARSFYELGEKQSARKPAFAGRRSSGGGESSVGNDSILFMVAEREHMIATIIQGNRVRTQRMFKCGPDPEMSLREVSMLLDYYSTRMGEYRNSVHCVLCGALAEDESFVEIARTELGVPMSVSEAGGKWCLCLGAANTDIDFGDPEMNRRGVIRRNVGGIWQYVFILIGGLALLASGITALGSAEIWKGEIQSLEDTEFMLRIQYAQSSDYAENYNNYISSYNRYSTDWDMLFDSVKTYNDNLVLILDELESILPKTTSVTNIAIAPDGLQLRISCPSKEEAAYVIIRMRSLQYASLMNISSLTGTTGQAAKAPDEEPPTEGSVGGIDLGILGDLGSLDDILGLIGGSNANSNLGIDADMFEMLYDLMNGSGGLNELSPKQRLGAIKYGLDKGIITKSDIVGIVDDLEAEDVAALEEFYGTLPDTEGETNAIIADASTEDKHAAFITMMETDRIARYYFSVTFNEDMSRDEDTNILYERISDELLLNYKALSALVSGNEDELERYMPKVLEIISADSENLDAAIELICTNERAKVRYSYYLEQETKRVDIPVPEAPVEPETPVEPEIPVEPSAPVAPIVPSSPSDIPSDEETVEPTPTPAPTPSPSPVPEEKPENEYDDLDSVKLTDDILADTVTSGLSDKGRAVVDDIVAETIKRIFASEKFDPKDYQTLLSYMGMSQLPGEDESGDLSDIIDSIINSGSNNNSGTGGAQEVDRNIYFNVVLGYDEALIQAERKRIGLSDEDKVQSPFVDSSDETVAEEDEAEPSSDEEVAE